MIGLEDLPSELGELSFAKVREQLFGFCGGTKRFIDRYGGYTKAQLYVAFEVPSEKLDECIAFLNAKEFMTSPKNEALNWHGAAKSRSVYFTDPTRNIMELWAPEKKTHQEL